MVTYLGEGIVDQMCAPYVNVEEEQLQPRRLISRHF